MAKPPALGKGLGALISTRSAGLTAPQPGERILALPLSDIIPSPLQPRTEFRPEQLSELIQSIRERGIIQPLIVRKVNGKYELIAGERRWRAAGEVGLKEAPAIVREASDVEVLELALVENLQREDLNPIEEAMAYARLSGEFSMTQEEIARKVGKNRATVANAMRLLDLAPEVQSYLRQGRLTVGHAKAILSIKAHGEQIQVAEQLIRQALPVRAAEKLVSRFLEKTGQPSPRKKRNSESASALAPHLHRIENALTHHLATRVQLRHAEKTGAITIEYYGNDDLDRILGILGVKLGE
jgi:ParB family transcriptional regulator, chromosome partitioning protein